MSPNSAISGTATRTRSRASRSRRRCRRARAGRGTRRRRDAGGPRRRRVRRLACTAPGVARARRAGLGVPGLPAAGRVARGRRGDQGRRASFADQPYWGRPGPGFGDPDAAAARRRPRPRGQRHQPHRPDVHRRPLRRLDVCRAAPAGLRQPAAVAGQRRRAGAARRTDRRRGPLRAAGEQADPAEQAACAHWLDRDLELAAPRLRVDAGARARSPGTPPWRARRLGWDVPRPKPRFGHGAEATLTDRRTAARSGWSAATT